MKPSIVFCVMRRHFCPIVQILRDSIESTTVSVGNGDNGTVLGSLSRPLLAARILRAHCENGWLEVWARVSGEAALMREFENATKRARRVRAQTVFKNPFNHIVRLLLPDENCRDCAWCPLVRGLMGAFVKSAVATPDFILVELVVSRNSMLKELEALGCEIVKQQSIEEMDYMLTPKQELALVYAFFRGYYSMPRRVGLKELAEELGLSISSLAEHLRKAEEKVVEAFMRHELPHYMVYRVIEGAMPQAGDGGKGRGRRKRKAALAAGEAK